MTMQFGNALNYKVIMILNDNYNYTVLDPLLSARYS